LIAFNRAFFAARPRPCVVGALLLARADEVIE